MEPTPLRMTDAQVAMSAILGAVFLMVGVLFESMGKPITPISAFPGLLIITIGLGLVATVLELYFPKFRGQVSIPLWALVFWFTVANDLSWILLCVFEGLHRLSQAVAVFYFRSRD